MSRKKRAQPSRREQQSVERRRRWVRLLRECEESGLSQTAFARQRGISVQTLRWWKSRLSREAAETDSTRAPRRSKRDRSRTGSQEPANLVAVEVVEQRVEAPGLELVLSGRRSVRVHGDFDPEILRKLVATVEGLEC